MGNSPFANLRSLVKESRMQCSLSQMGPESDLSIACVLDDEHHAYSSGEGAPASVDARVDIGCLAKNLTSLLVAIASSERRLRYADHVTSYFNEWENVDRSLRIDHLLSHSHGLDGSALIEIPRTSDGHIDSVALWQGISAAPAVFRPGSMFYYWGSAGVWIAAAILERVYGCRFSELLEEKILRQIYLSPRTAEISPVCPASGGMSLSANELLRLCSLHLSHLRNGLPADPIRQLGNMCDVQLPEWPPVADGVGLGWFRYSGSTLGCSGSLAEILVSPEENAAMALTGRAVAVARFQLLGPLTVPRGTRNPRLLTKDECLEVSWQKHAGTYRKASLVLEILPDEKAGLRAEVYRCMKGGGCDLEPFITRSLLPAVNDTFYPAPPEREVIQFVRFEHLGEDDKFTYAISGMHIFRRSGASLSEIRNHFGESGIEAGA